MTLDHAIISTLAYHDIFDYPLTKEEIYKYLIEKKLQEQELDDGIKNLTRTGRIGGRKSFYFLKNRNLLAQIRQKRMGYSKDKYKKAKFFANILKSIPTAKLVAISGALSMGNSHKNDDIDLVLVTAPNSLWTTRFLANLLLFPFKRKPHQPLTINHSQSTKDRACLNLFIDESNLSIKPRNLYIAHEICQMKVLWDKNQTYSRLIKANSWIKKFLPNWLISSQLASPTGGLSVNSSRNIKPSTINRQPLTIEILLKRFQLFYMRSKISTERIGDTQLFFHPQNTQDWVLKEYRKRLKKLRITSP